MEMLYECILEAGLADVYTAILGLPLVDAGAAYAMPTALGKGMPASCSLKALMIYPR